MKSRAVCQKLVRLFALPPVLFFLLCNSAYARHYKYIHIGQKDDARTKLPRRRHDGRGQRSG